jgi:hypothetical protein
MLQILFGVFIMEVLERCNIIIIIVIITIIITSSSYHRVGIIVELFQSHTSRSLFSGLSCFLLPFGLQFFYYCQ